MDFLLRVFLSTNEWLNVCVAIERTATVIQGASFNFKKCKDISKYVIIIIFLLITVSFLSDPFHRKLVDDIEDGQTWCVIDYPHSFAVINSIVLIVHFLIPFVVNIISALLIIILTARHRSTTQKQLSHREHFFRQLRQQKHLIISPILSVILAIPQLVMSFLSGCMSSTRDSWFFLFGYLSSFVSPILIFFRFVLPSETYKKEFFLVIKRK